MLEQLKYLEEQLTERGFSKEAGQITRIFKKIAQDDPEIQNKAVSNIFSNEEWSVSSESDDIVKASKSLLNDGAVEVEINIPDQSLSMRVKVSPEGVFIDATTWLRKSSAINFMDFWKYLHSMVQELSSSQSVGDLTMRDVIHRAEQVTAAKDPWGV